MRVTTNVSNSDSGEGVSAGQRQLTGARMNHAIICLKEEMRALQDARRQVLLDPDELGPLAGQILREIKDLKHAIEVLRAAKADAAKEAA
jgi:hypothetical protein